MPEIHLIMCIDLRSFIVQEGLFTYVYTFIAHICSIVVCGSKFALFIRMYVLSNYK